MPQTPWYDPTKSYDENFNEGPFGDFATPASPYADADTPYDFFGKPLRFPFGIPAGPLLNGAYVKAALERGFDTPVYKTVRTRSYPAHPWPNIVAVDAGESLTLEEAQRGLTTRDGYDAPLSITNSFGVPSKDPSFWQNDMADAARHAKNGQHVIGSFQGTAWPDASHKEYMNDWVTAAKLVAETGVSAIEADLSCPNEDAASLLCFDIEKTRAILVRIKEAVGDVPLIAKIAYFEDEPLRDFVEALGGVVQGIAAVNAIASAIRNADGRQALPGEGRLKSGVCGASIKWAGLSMARRLKHLRETHNRSYVIFGVGGVTVPEDYSEYREAGADIVMSATGAMWDGNLARKVREYVSGNKRHV